MTDDRLRPSPTDESEDLLSRWSRRKAEARSAPLAPEQPAAPEPLPPGDEDMPPLESLDADSDYSPFLSPRVSAELQRLALRKLFRVPAFNVRDGLDDYDEDFTTFVSLGEVVTAEMRRRLQIEAERLAQAAEDDAARPPETGETAGTTVDPAPRPEAARDAPDDADDVEVRT
jgi:hypothetical protein